MSAVNPQDFFERESEENNGDDTPPATENDWVEVETNERPRMDDTATKDGETPKADGNTPTPARRHPNVHALILPPSAKWTTALPSSR